MNTPDEELKRLRDWKEHGSHLSGASRGVHNAEIDLEIQILRHAIALIEKHIAELEGLKVEEA